ncbi:MAG: phage tail protein [Hoeflea sp.]|uniref:phage tail protein n=1 Tax=Hoeflea sp. TaxID=1940281 RepID=UPI000C0EA7A2|nr:tail fiber protein [Hoeflea sp.]PHR19001.1 MAG: phage tail protein [Hoeflea sp.]|tara:strand:- start:96187 stop:96714 length:528 start_codon:yes stop_codon:yes gene_type:complete
MSEPFVAEIRIFAGNFAPRSWAFCDGQLLPIANNTALFSLIGTTYGGDGRSTTALPNLQGRAPMHPGRGPGLTSRRLGQRIGVDRITLSEAQMPSHSHTARATSSRGSSSIPDSTSSIAASGFDSLYQTGTSANLVDMAFESLSTTGGGQTHENMQPYLVLNFIIALQGLYPSRG